MEGFALVGGNQNKIEDGIMKIRNLGDRYITKVHLVYGEYDIIAEIKAFNPETSTNILKTIKEIEGVNNLKTYVVSDQLTDEVMLTLPPESC